MTKVLTIIGTRPEVVKTAILQKLMSDDPNIYTIYCSTGQHKTLLTNVLQEFSVDLDIELDAMSHNQSLSVQASYMMKSLQEVVENTKPDLIIVQGDTLSAYCGALVAFYNKIKLAHIEAGLRTGNKHGPYPEEIHRKYIDDVSDMHFVHSELARQNLLTEGHLTDSVYMVGNTGIDALLVIRNQLEKKEIRPQQEIIDLVHKLRQKSPKLALLTLHRRESSGRQQKEIIRSITRCAQGLNMQIIMVNHPNPILRSNIEALSTEDRIELIEPLGYVSFIWLMTEVDVIYSDSGGIQEEAPYLGKNVVVLRNETERQEIIENDNSQLYAAENLLEITSTLLQSESQNRMLYGDGKASTAIVQIIKDAFTK